MMVFLQDTDIEIIDTNVDRGHIKYALFDFDGTISLIREGWRGVMIPMMVQILKQTPRHESEQELQAVVTEFVDRLTGRQTIYQMLRLCEEIRHRGAIPLDALDYKRMYLERLWKHIEGRVNGLKEGTLTPEEVTVPGSLQMLEALRDRGVVCYLASGTDEPYVRDEAGALGVSPHFAGVYGALDDYRSYSKKMVIERIVAENGLSGPEFVTFGDGFVEMEETVAVGGIAVGVASDEGKREGIDAWKRKRLMEAGAAIIIPEFRQHEQLLRYLFAEE